MCHSFFIPLSADEHLVCFHVSTIVNSAAMNTSVPISVQIIVFSVCMPPRVGLLAAYFFFLLVALGLHVCMQAFPSCGTQASHCGGFSCCRAQALGAQTSVGMVRRLSSFGSWAQLLCSFWDLPRPGIELVSPALAGGFLSTVPTRKSCFCFLGEPLYFFPQWLQQFISPPTMQKASLFSIPSPAFGICRHFNDGHYDWCQVAPLLVLICLFLIIIHDHLLT